MVGNGGGGLVLQLSGGGGGSRAATAQEVAAKVAEVTGGKSQTQAKTLASRYELINASVQWTVGTGRQQTTVTVKSPLQASDLANLEKLLPTLVDKTTTQQ